jgi:hypothetical protein
MPRDGHARDKQNVLRIGTVTTASAAKTAFTVGLMSSQTWGISPVLGALPQPGMGRS